MYCMAYSPRSSTNSEYSICLYRASEYQMFFLSRRRYWEWLARNPDKSFSLSENTNRFKIIVEDSKLRIRTRLVESSHTCKMSIPTGMFDTIEKNLEKYILIGLLPHFSLQTFRQQPMPSNAKELGGLDFLADFRFSRMSHKTTDQTECLKHIDTYIIFRIEHPLMCPWRTTSWEWLVCRMC